MCVRSAHVSKGPRADTHFVCIHTPLSALRASLRSAALALARVSLFTLRIFSTCTGFQEEAFARGEGNFSSATWRSV